MNKNTSTPSSEEVVIDLAPLDVSPSVDEIDGRRRTTNIAHIYHTKKSMAEGMMDISLLTANANQLKFIIYYNQQSMTFYPALSLIVLSLILQIAIGFLLIFRRRFKTHGRNHEVNVMNEHLVLLIFLVTIINIFAAVLTTTDDNSEAETMGTFLNKTN